MLRRMSEADIEYVVNLYANYMPASFFNKFGKDFMKIIFNGILNSKYGINYVYAEDLNVAGFISASVYTEKLFNEIMLKNKLPLLKIMFLNALKRPCLLMKIIEPLFYFKKTRHQNIKAELLFIAIDPQYRKKGISKDLIMAVLNKLKDMCISKVKVTVLKENIVVNKLLQDLNFDLVGRFKFYGNETLLYKIAF